MGLSLGVVPVKTDQPAAIFAFRGDALLVDAQGHAPRVLNPRDLGLATEEMQYIGVFEGAPCYGADLGEGTPPSGLRLASLRELVGVASDAELAAAGTASQILHWHRTHRFCGHCGAPLTVRPAVRAKQCPSCGLDAFPRINPTVLALVHDGPRVLMVRPRRFPPRLYVLVTGFVEPGETLEACVAREVREETGVLVDDIRYFGSQPWPFPNQLVCAFFARALQTDVVVARDELDDARWFDASALPAMPPPAFFNILRPMIDAWLASPTASEK